MNISVSEAREKFADLVNRVQYGGERVVIEKRGKPSVVMVSVEEAAFLEAMEERALGKMADEAMKDWEADGFRTHSLAEVLEEIKADEAGAKG